MREHSLGMREWQVMLWPGSESGTFYLAATATAGRCRDKRLLAGHSGQHFVIESPTLRDDRSRRLYMTSVSGRLISAIVAAFILPACVCWSQTNFGRISGTVQDASGALIPSAAVT